MGIMQMLMSGGGGLDVSEVFDTYLYEGDGVGGTTPRAITTGMDLDAPNVGMIWVKCRDGSIDHALFDTIRGATEMLRSDGNGSELLDINSLTAFTSDGFTTNGSAYTNLISGSGGGGYVAWSFKAAPKFFDVVTWTGDAVDTTTLRTISHNLGCKPGMIIVKDRDDSESWAVYHTAIGSDKYLVLDTSAGKQDDSSGLWWGDTEPTSSVFTIQSANMVNKYDDNYVAYLFAEDEDNIKCGSFNGTAGTTVNVGFEPQWVILKRTDGGDYWYILDKERGLPTADSTDSTGLFADSPASETSWSNEPRIYTTATGFTVSTGTGLNPNPYLYIAIKKED